MTLLGAARDYRPRRAPGLPSGQRVVAAMPRFSDDPMRWAPPLADPCVEIIVEGEPAATVDLRVAAADAVERTHDFHCVTGWSYRGVQWGGVVLRELMALDTTCDIDALPRFARVQGADDRHAVFMTEDLLDPSVLLATELDGELVSRRHGGAVRLVAPKQYGYKNVKHVVRIEFLAEQPESSFGKKEHLRARIAHEERHATLPNWLIRLPYRMMVVPTALMGDRGLRSSPD